jgi:hypothetical protein
MLLLLAKSAIGTADGMKILRSGLVALSLAVLISSAAIAQDPPVGPNRPPTMARQDDEYGITRTVVFGGLLGLSVAVSAVAITWVIKRKRPTPRRDADEVVKRVG